MVMHLLPNIKATLDLPDSDRIALIEKDCWIGYPRAKLFLNKLQSLYLHPQRQRMPNLLIVGPTNNGKSMILEKFYRDNYSINPQSSLQKSNIAKDYPEVPILSIQMLPTAEIYKFYRSILDKLRSIRPYPGFYTSSPREEDIVRALIGCKTKMLIIDEIHNILGSPASKQHQFLNALRYFGNVLKIPIVCAGTKDAYMAIRSDPQLENRFEPFLLSTWRAGKDYESLLASIGTILPLKNASNLNHPSISKFILDKSEGVLGEIFTLIRRAAIMAVYSKREMIDGSLLKEIDYHSPSERIRLFERTITGII